MPTYAGKKEKVEDTITGWQFRETTITWTEEVHETLGWQECEYCGENEHYDENPTTVEITKGDVEAISQSLSNSITNNAQSTIGGQLQGTGLGGLTGTISTEITAGKSKTKTSALTLSKQFSSAIGTKQTFDTRKHSNKKGIMKREDYGICASVTIIITITLTLKPNGDPIGWPATNVDVQSPSIDFCRRLVMDREIDCDKEPIKEGLVLPEPTPFDEEKQVKILLPKDVYAQLSVLAEAKNQTTIDMIEEIIKEGTGSNLGDTKGLSLFLPKEIYTKIDNLAKKEGKATSEIILGILKKNTT